MTDDYNAGVEAAAKVMDDLDRSGWFAAAIRARAKRDDPGVDGFVFFGAGQSRGGVGSLKTD